MEQDCIGKYCLYLAAPVIPSPFIHFIHIQERGWQTQQLFCMTSPAKAAALVGLLTRGRVNVLFHLIFSH
jgi:hypothetical protein